MDTSENSLVTKIRKKLIECLQRGNLVEAIKFYHEVTLTPLLESKQFVESFQADNNRPIVHTRFEPFLKFLEDRDFGGAAACLCAEERLPSDAIKSTLRIARTLDLDVTALDLPPSIGISLAESTQAQTIVNERALELTQQRMVRNLVKGGTSQEEAENLIGVVHKEFAKGLSVSPKPVAISFEGTNPHLARVVSLLSGPIPLANQSLPQATVHRITSSTKTTDETTIDAQRKAWFRRIGKFAALVYVSIAIVGVAMLGYSYFSISHLALFSMSQGLPSTEQEARISEWTDQNMPTTLPWFIPSVQEQFFPVRLEPGLPIAYANEDWPWEKRIVAINGSADEIVARLKRCHEVLFVLYSMAILIAVLHWFNLDIVSGVLMVLLGVFGIPFLSIQIWRFEFDSLLWLGPLLIPGMIALIASSLDLALITPETDRRKELRAFWFGAILFMGAGLFLGWAILQGNHLKPGAGLGVFGGACLMLRHGWRYLKASMRNRGGTG